MNTFGEINEPSTRSAWEDWDDFHIIENSEALHLQNNVDTIPNIETFMILEGRYLYDSVRDHSESLELINCIPEVNLLLYKTKANNNYICIIKDYNLVQSSEIIEAIKDYVINSVDVIAVTLKPLVDYQTAKLITKDYVLRSLTTSNPSPRLIISKISSLEQPNIISGLGAGVLSLREVIDKPAVTFVCYIDHPEELEIDELNKLLQSVHIKPFRNNVKNNILWNSNLYI